MVVDFLEKILSGEPIGLKGKSIFIVLCMYCYIAFQKVSSCLQQGRRAGAISPQPHQYLEFVKKFGQLAMDTDVLFQLLPM